jgi:uncharacterized membrane protein SpoIIM required for sporulation
MREVAFIKQNKEKWLGIEHVTSGKVKKNPDELSSLYINLINDLSFAKTYYPKSKTTVYLNHLSTLMFQKIYKTKRVEENRFLYFFKTEVPLLVYQYRKYLFFAFSLFIIFILIGVVSSHYDKNFVTMILGEDYVNMTVENIKKGNPIGVYESGSNWGSSLAIIQNNLTVGLKLYIYGLFAGIGTVLFAMFNSIMVGSFQYFFQTQGALGQSARGIWVHGVFEIFSMVIETMAGLVLGASILFPKTFSRLNSFKIGFKDSFKIFLSTVPFTIVAGILEGYVTRYALKMNLGINLFIIFGTLFIISYYYIYYPFIVNKKRGSQNSI